MEYRLIKFLCIFFLYINCFCEEAIFTSNTGGLNSKGSPIFVGKNEASDLLNVNLDTDGSISSRNGYTTLNTTVLPGRVDGLYHFKKNNGTAYLIAAATNLYKMDSFDGTWDDITGTTSITANSPAQMLTFDDTLVVLNNDDKIQNWTGTGTASDNECYTDIVLTSAKTMEVYQNRLYLFNVTVDGSYYPDRGYYSAAQQIATWDGSYFTVGFDDGDEIIGSDVLGSYLYVLKKNSIYRVRGTGDSTVPHTIDKTAATEGCISRGSIQKVNNMIVYLSQKGLTVFDGTTSKVISTKIQPTIDALDGDLKVLSKSVVMRN